MSRENPNLDKLLIFKLRAQAIFSTLKHEIESQCLVSLGSDNIVHIEESITITPELVVDLADLKQNAEQAKRWEMTVERDRPYLELFSEIRNIMTLLNKAKTFDDLISLFIKIEIVISKSIYFAIGYDSLELDKKDLSDKQLKLANRFDSCIQNFKNKSKALIYDENLSISTKEKYIFELWNDTLNKFLKSLSCEVESDQDLEIFLCCIQEVELRVEPFYRSIVKAIPIIGALKNILTEKYGPRVVSDIFNEIRYQVLQDNYDNNLLNAKIQDVIKNGRQLLQSAVLECKEPIQIDKAKVENKEPEPIKKPIIQHPEKTQKVDVKLFLRSPHEFELEDSGEDHSAAVGTFSAGGLKQLPTHIFSSTPGPRKLQPIKPSQVAPVRSATLS